MDSGAYRPSWHSPSAGTDPPSSQAWPGYSQPMPSVPQSEAALPSPGNLAAVNHPSRQFISPGMSAEWPSAHDQQIPPVLPLGQSLPLTHQNLDLASQQTPPTARNKRWQPPDFTWEALKETMRLQYLTQNHTLQDTMTYMQIHHDFRASRKMYTQRFKDWGFVKNLKRREAKTIFRHQAMRGNKPTETRVRNTVISEVRVARSIGRHQKKEDLSSRDKPTPTNSTEIIVATPLGTSNMPTPANPKNISTTASTPIPAGWTPSFATPSGAGSDIYTSTARVDWRNMSQDELRELKLEALRSFANGNARDAEYKFRDALAGFRHKSGSTDRCTLRTAYQLASLYARLSRMEDADKVLQWALDSHVNKWSLEHPRTIAHLIQVAKLQDAWSDSKSQVTLVRNILDRLENYSKNREMDRIVLSDGNIDEEDGSREQDHGPEDETGNTNEVETTLDLYLHLEGTWLDSHRLTTEQLLNHFITQCERHPKDLSVCALKARLMLLRFHEEQKQINDAFRVAKVTTRSILQVVSGQSGLQLLELVEVSTDLAFFYFDNDSPEKCDKLLSWLAAKLERGIAVGPHCDTSLSSASLFLMIRVATEYHQRDKGGWRRASPWLERAYGLIVGLEGPEHCIAKTLEEMIKTRELNFHQGTIKDGIKPSLHSVFCHMVKS